MSIKISLHRWALLLTVLLLSKLQQDVNSAPTKHLKVTANGDTPKLIVTSEEDFGIEPKRLVAAKFRPPKTTIVSTENPTKYIERHEQTINDKMIKKHAIPNEQPQEKINRNVDFTPITSTSTLSYKNPLNLIYSGAKTTTGMSITTEHEKNANPADGVTSYVSDELNIYIRTTTIPMARSIKTTVVSEGQTTLEPIMESKIKYTIQSIAEKEDEKDIIKQQFKVKESEKNIKLSLATTASPLATITVLGMIENSTKVGKLPLDKFQHQQIATEAVTTDILMPATVTEHGELLIVGTEKNHSFNSTPTIERAMILEAGNEGMSGNTGFLSSDKENKENMSNQEKQEIPMVAQHMTEVVIPIEKTTTITTNTIKSTPTVSTSAVEATKESVIITPTDVMKQDMKTTTKATTKAINDQNPKSNYSNAVKEVDRESLTSSVTFQKIITSSTTSKTILSNMDIMLNEQPEKEDDDDDEVKLIDLEKQENKSAELQRKEKLLKQKNLPQHLQTKDADHIVDDADGGHDGIKKTKKKQLQIDKHILADIGISTPQPSPPTSTPLRRTTTTTKHNLKIKSEIGNISPKVKKSEGNIDEIKQYMVTTKPIKETKKQIKNINEQLGPLHGDKEIYNVKQRTRETYIESHFSNEDKKSLTYDTTNFAAIKKKNKERKKKFNLLTITKSPYVFSEFQITTTPQPYSDRKLLLEVINMKKGSSTTEKPLEVTSNDSDERTESKISDIQVEVYDSTIDSIVASTNFQDSAVNNVLQNSYSLISTKKPPAIAALQERFTQYVVDPVESSTQESNIAAPLLGAYDKPEPAAIEIHINVSEGVGSGGEDLEFSYPQSNYDNTETSMGLKVNLASKMSTSKLHEKLMINNDESRNISNEDEVLVVEIIDTGENNTANSASSENINPIFTFRSMSNGNEVEFKNYSDGTLKTSLPLRTSTDELFMANMQKYDGESTPSAPPTHVRKPTIDHDSDTIFYISNTEVKVGESLPTSNIDSELSNTELKQHQPSAYVLSTYPNLKRHRFEEDILLSPIQNTADSLKIFRSQNAADGAPPLDVTYVAESVMKVEQLPSPSNEKEPQNHTLPQALNNSTDIQTPGQVIIQPATLSEIGLPVIGELPPQIKLKEFDFMPDELTNHEQPSGSYTATLYDGPHGEQGEEVEEEEEHVNINDVERLVDSSIQYGGDLIDEGAVGVGGGSSFDGVEGSYPFANLATMGRHGKKNVKAKYAGAHSVVNHGVNNLRKNILSVDMEDSDSIAESTNVSRDVNATIKESKYNADQNVNGSAASLNITFAIAERMINSTAASLMENPQMTSMHIQEDYYWSIFALTASTLIATIPVATILSMFFVLRYFYNKYQLNSNDSSENDFSPDGGNDAKTYNGNADDEPDGDESESTELQTSTSSDKLNPNQSTSSNHANRSLTSSNKNNPLFKPSSYANEYHDVELAEIQNYTSYVENNNNSVANSQCRSVANFKFNSPNGSVIKMTLKNNHLIVETEQRNDISRNIRETKMHYNNATGRDGVFVVEVSRGIDSQHLPESPITEREQCFMNSIISHQQQRILLSEKNEKSPSLPKKEEEVQIHQPPKDVEKAEEKSQIKLQQIVEVEEECNLVKNSYTGLSQPDLSSSSSSIGSNNAYNYGNQSLYTDDLTMGGKNTPKMAMIENKAHAIKLQLENDNSKEVHVKIEPLNQISNTKDCNETLMSNNSFNNDKTAAALISNEIKTETKLIKNIMPTSNTGILPVTEVVDAAEKVVARIEEEVESTLKSLNEELPKIYTASDLLQNATNEKSSFNETNFKNEEKLENNEDKLLKVSNDNNLTAENDIIEMETTTEKGYDSLMSLPEPPSFEEIKQLNDCSSVENNQLDSLNLPPPPPAFLMAELQVQKEVLVNNQQSTEIIEAVLAKNDQIGQQRVPEPFEKKLQVESIELNVNNDSELLSAQLTPPESPPGANCSNGVGNNGLRHKVGICAPLSAVAVDVNGS